MKKNQGTILALFAMSVLFFSCTTEPVTPGSDFRAAYTGNYRGTLTQIIDDSYGPNDTTITDSVLIVVEISAEDDSTITLEPYFSPAKYIEGDEFVSTWSVGMGGFSRTITFFSAVDSIQIERNETISAGAYWHNTYFVGKKE